MAGPLARIFALPDLGEGLHEAEIVAWHVGPGDHVVADQPLVSVETDKAVVEIPSPRAGRVARLLAEPGARLAIGAPLVEFTEGAEHDAGTVVGELAEEPPTSPPGQPGTGPVAGTRPAAAAAGRVRAAPAVRALARSFGVALERVTGSGKDGEVLRADVEAAAAAMGAPEGFQPLAGVRRAMARRMAAAGAEVVPATVTDEADVGHWPETTDVTVRLIQALVAACRAEPSLNAAFDSRALARRLDPAVHVGIAVDTEDGLFVPVIRHAESRDGAALRQALDIMTAELARRAIAPEMLRGATITLSNFGTMGGRYGALVVVPPQVAILGAGRIAPRPTVRDGVVVATRMLPLSLTFDHRAASGGEAARFLEAVKGALERKC